SNINYIDTNIRGNYQNVMKFEIVLADMSNDETELDVIDNMNQVATDFIIWLENHQDLEINNNIPIIPFSDDFSDRASGVVFFVSFITHRNNCGDILPIK